MWKRHKIIVMLNPTRGEVIKLIIVEWSLPPKPAENVLKPNLPAASYNVAFPHFLWENVLSVYTYSSTLAKSDQMRGAALFSMEIKPLLLSVFYFKVI